MTSNRKFYRYLGLLVALGAGLRLINVLGIYTEDHFISDHLFYHQTGQLIANGRWFIDPFMLSIGGKIVPSAAHPPLFPGVLGIASVFGLDSFQDHQLVGSFLGLITVALTGLLGRKVGGDRVGLLAAAIAALYPVFIGMDGSIMSESLYGLLICATLLTAYYVLESRSLWSTVLLGVLIGLAALTRGEALLLLPLLVLPLVLINGQQRVLKIVLAGVAVIVVLAPWSVRNYQEFGRFVLISNNESTVVSGANCDKTYTGSELGSWSISCISPRKVDDEAAQADIWRAQGFDYMGAHTKRLIGVVVPVRVLRTWSFYQPFNSAVPQEAQNRRVANAGTVAYYLLFPLAIFGLILLRRRRLPIFVLLAPVAMVTITSMIGFGYPRFRYAAEFTIIVSAAIALDAFIRRLIQNRSSSKLEPAD